MKYEIREKCQQSGKNRWKIYMPALYFLILLSGGCASTFLVSKDCKTYFFGSNEESLYRMLCTSGDLKRVLHDTDMPQETKESLYSAHCIERSRDKVTNIYRSLTDEQKSSLKSSFQRHGYDINYKPVENYRFRYYNNIDFCPPDAVY